jgi:hypothetical protein
VVTCTSVETVVVTVEDVEARTGMIVIVKLVVMVFVMVAIGVGAVMVCVLLAVFVRMLVEMTATIPAHLTDWG